jgi:hypothetical protein
LETKEEGGIGIWWDEKDIISCYSNIDDKCVREKRRRRRLCSRGGSIYTRWVTLREQFF